MTKSYVRTGATVYVLKTDTYNHGVEVRLLTSKSKAFNEAKRLFDLTPKEMVKLMSNWFFEAKNDGRPWRVDILEMEVE